ncbi:hypothetical protein GCM10022393_38140 [Aquimarina addita]|uniref:BZIP domain-containing protein n=2 Tax=Aquimarina addita TaxID=870485 RepID=A0ABP6UVH8_9FLAO
MISNLNAQQYKDSNNTTVTAQNTQVSNAVKIDPKVSEMDTQSEVLRKNQSNSKATSRNKSNSSAKASMSIDEAKRQRAQRMQKIKANYANKKENEKSKKVTEN